MAGSDGENLFTFVRKGQTSYTLSTSPSRARGASIGCGQRPGSGLWWRGDQDGWKLHLRVTSMRGVFSFACLPSVYPLWWVSAKDFDPYFSQVVCFHIAEF